MLQKYDAERDEAQRAAMWGVGPKDNALKPPKQSPSNGRQQTMTQEDIMRNYGR